MDVAEIYLLDIKGDEDEIRIYGVSEDRKRFVCIYKNFKQYFYVWGKNLDTLKEKIEKITVTGKRKVYRVLNVEKVTKKLLGDEKEVLKVYINGGLNEIKEVIKSFPEYEDKREDDISIWRKFLVDFGLVPFSKIRIYGKIINKKEDIYFFNVERIENLGDQFKDLKILAFDIETYNYRGNPRPEVDPIILISVYGKDIQKVFSWKENKSEMEMIKEFFDFIKEYKPDVLVGYNSDLFDIKYLIERARKYRIDFDLSWDGEGRKVKRGGNYIFKTNGLILIDLYPFIRNIMATSLETETYDLNSVAQEILGLKKEDIYWEDIWKNFDKGGEDYEKLKKYCLNDSKLTYLLALEILPLMIEISRIISIPLFDVCRMTYSQYVEAYLIKESRRFDELCEKRPREEEVFYRNSKIYKGAYVHEPKPGIYENIVVFDFRSLYPSIIITYNISPDTLNKECKNKTVVEIDKEKFEFCKDKKGFIPSIIKNLIDRRIRIKKLLKEIDKNMTEYKLLYARQLALKTIANAMYGYMGFPRARWYCFECARSITALARKHILETINFVEKKGFEVIYADTDSVFINLKKKGKKDALRLLEEINKNLPGVMELEFQGFYPRGIFVSKKGEIERGAKKKYALIDEKGNLVIKGFEYVRRDWANIAKKVQIEILRVILEKGDIKKALEIAKDYIEKLKKQEISVEDVVILTQLTKDINTYEQMAPHVVVAKKLKEKGYYVEPGVIIKYIVVEGSGKISDRAIPLEEFLSKKMRYDADYYINRQILPAIRGIFEVLGYSKEDILGEAKQQKLSDFFR